MSKEAMKLALEALEDLIPLCDPGFSVCYDVNKAITALRESLAEQPEPVQPGRNHYEDGDVFERIAAMKKQPAQQEPVAWISKHGVVYPFDAKDEVHPINDLQPLYTSLPAKRTWVGLSDESIVYMMPAPVLLRANVERWDRAGLLAFARAIEAKLKELNT